MDMADRQVVLALFPDEASADAAVDGLKGWDKLSADVKLNAIGVLVLDEHGKVKQHKLGRHDTGKGAGIGFILGLLAVTVATAGVGLVVGALVGRMIHKSLGLSKEDMARLAGELQGGKAAVGVLVDRVEADPVAAKLAELGGVPETHPVAEDQLADAAAADAADAAAAAPAAADAEAAPAADAATAAPAADTAPTA
jgi:uncharacterized membrane protein